MKGDGNIKIKIKFIGVGYNNFYQVDVAIYDKDMNKVFKGKTYNGELDVYLNKNEVYIMKANFNGQVLCSPLIILDGNYIFSFVKNNRTVTFLLTDYYYNLPIEKGEIILWQK